MKTTVLGQLYKHMVMLFIPTRVRGNVYFPLGICQSHFETHGQHRQMQNLVHYQQQATTIFAVAKHTTNLLVVVIAGTSTNSHDHDIAPFV